MTDQRSLVRRLKTGTMLAGTVLAAGQGAKYITQVALARWMDAAEYGAYVYAMGWVILLTAAATLGLGFAALRFIPEFLNRSEPGDAARFVVFSRRAVSAAGLALAAVIAAVAQLGGTTGTTATAVTIGGLLLPLHAVVELQTKAGSATGEVFRAFAPSFLLWPLMTVVFAFGLRSVGTLDATQALVATGLALATVTTVQAVFLRRKLGPPGTQLPPGQRKLWLSVGGPLMLSGGLMLVVTRADVVMMGLMRSPTETGFYSAAARTASLAALGLASVGMVVAPMIGRLHAEGDFAGLQRACRSAARWMTVASGTVAVIIWLAGPAILTLFGPQFRVAATPLLVLALGQVLNASTGPIGHLLNLTGHERRALVPYAAAAVLNVGLGLLLIPPYGMTGAAIATAVSLVGWNAWMVVLARRCLGLWTFAFGPRTPHRPDPT